MDNIILIGMPGAGKSTVGVILSKIVNLNFTDTDLLIQQAQNKKLCDIITEKGVNANGLHHRNIPVYIREQIEEHIEPFFLQEDEKKNVKAVAVAINDKEYNVECAIYESASPLMELTFYAGDRETAARIVRNFKKNTEEIYGKFMETLLGEEE